jgi:hypothetical protein
MNTNNEVVLGKANYGKQNGFGGGLGWFYIENNKDNVYRVLPPMKSLAAEGKYAKYYRTHRGFRGSDGKQKPFQCIEEFNFKQKLITRHCPICDIVADLTAEVATFKERGATDDQIREYRNKNIFPFQAEGKYYLNVVNTEGKIGILAIGNTMFKALDLLAQEQEKKGKDICGVEGFYLNFKNKSEYKGDKKPIPSVELAQKEDEQGNLRYVPHSVNQEFAQRLVKEAADLGNIFKTLDIEQITRIVQLQGDERAKYMDSLFAGDKQPVAPVAAAPTSTNGGQASAPAAPVQAPSFTPPAGFGSGGTSQQTPQMAPASPAPSAPVGFTPPAGFGTAAGPAPQSSFSPPAGFGGSPAPAAAGGASMSTLNDQDFLNMVRPKKV